MAIFSKSNSNYPKSRRGHTTTTLTGPRKGSKPPGLIMRVRGGSKVGYRNRGRS